jgi:hypothetical protein
MADPSYLESVLVDGQAAADEIADTTLKQVKTVMGFYLPEKRR